jgi:hypothetical protein
MTIETVTQSVAIPQGTATTDENLRHVLALAREHLRELLQQRAVLLRRITTLRRTLSGLAEVFGDHGSEEERKDLGKAIIMRNLGLTGACREALMSSRRPLVCSDVV